VFKFVVHAKSLSFSSSSALHAIKMSSGFHGCIPSNIVVKLDKMWLPSLIMLLYMKYPCNRAMIITQFLLPSLSICLWYLMLKVSPFLDKTYYSTRVLFDVICKKSANQARIPDYFMAQLSGAVLLIGLAILPFDVLYNPLRDEMSICPRPTKSAPSNSRSFKPRCITCI
jgi:hypothetical protein